MIRLSDISIKTKLIIYSVLMVVVVSILISLSAYKASENTMKKQAGHLASASIEQVAKRADLFLNNIHRSAMILRFNKDLIELMTGPQFNYSEDYNKIKKYSDYIETFYNVNKVHSLYVYDLNHMIYLSTRGEIYNNIGTDDENYKIIRENFIDKDLKDAPFYIWIAGRKSTIRNINQRAENIISFFMPMWADNYTLLGVLIINVPEKSIESMYSSSSLVTSGDFFIEGSRGLIISSISKDRIGSKSNIPAQGEPENMSSYLARINGKECLITSYKSDYVGWRYISVIPMNELMKDNIKNINDTLLLIVIIVVILAISFSYLFNSLFYKPVEKLIDGMEISIQKHGEIDFKIKRKDEIGFIFRKVNDILSENSRLIKEVYEQKVLSQNSELRLLQSQINPHFLYNSLDIAIWKIKLNDSVKAVKIIESLIKLFRLSLEKGKEILTVRQEIENLNSYINIQKIRYRERLKIDIEVEEDIIDRKILKLLLQPLVENAICHGIEKKEDAGIITVTGKKTGDSFVFTVRDDGIGIRDDRLEEIRKLIDSNEYDPENFYALQNINKRVKLYYGEQYGITIESKENEWTIVNLTLPLEQNVDHMGVNIHGLQN